MLWDPFLIKKLLKSVICGIVNSARMHCSQLTKSIIAAEPKKKKKEKNAVIKRRRRNNCNPNSHLIAGRERIRTIGVCTKNMVSIVVVNLFLCNIYEDKVFVYNFTHYYVYTLCYFPSRGQGIFF